MAILDRLGAMVGDERLDRLERGRRRIVQTAGGEIFEECACCFDRILLVRTDHAARATLDPAGAVDARHGLARRVERTPLGMGDHAALLVERYALDG